VAPAVLLYIWTMSEIRGLGWAVALLFGVCSALRLARFNTQLGIPDPPSYAYNFFTGVPAPAAAGLAMLPLCAAFEFDLPLFRSPWLSAVTTIAVAGLMVSQLPTFSGKRLRVPTQYAAPLLIGVGVVAAFLTTEPWLTLLTAGLLYVASFPVSVRSYAKLKQAAEALRAGRKEADPPVLRAVGRATGTED
jgi:CDP-diacylglycerol--serine O-phosphatidyltransferase